MASSRKDTKGYVLRTGECQRSDGRCSYSYTGQESNRHVVYAKFLAELRKKERKIIRDLEDGIDAHAPEKPQRHALTIPQQKAFVDFITTHKEYCGWCPVLMVLLGTGMRIGECLGLRWDDLDFEQRTIPMMDEVYEAFLQEYEMQKCMGYVSEEIDGFTNFVFLTAGGSVLSAGSVNRAITNISEAYFLYKVL